MHRPAVAVPDKNKLNQWYPLSHQYHATPCALIMYYKWFLSFTALRFWIQTTVSVKHTERNNSDLPRSSNRVLITFSWEHQHNSEETYKDDTTTSTASTITITFSSSISERRCCCATKNTSHPASCSPASRIVRTTGQSGFWGPSGDYAHGTCMLRQCFVCFVALFDFRAFYQFHTNSQMCSPKHLAFMKCTGCHALGRKIYPEGRGIQGGQDLRLEELLSNAT